MINFPAAVGLPAQNFDRLVMNRDRLSRLTDRCAPPQSSHEPDDSGKSR